MSKRKNPHVGGSLDDFLKSDGLFEEVQAQAVAEVAAWQNSAARNKRGAHGKPCKTSG
jgi:hypothetical protein